MSFHEIARRWTVVLLAETLRISVSAIETALPFQPRWLAHVSLLATQLRAAADGDDGQDDGDIAAVSATGDDGQADELPDHRMLLESHTRLRQGLSDIVARGLGLDDELLKRMRTDWSAESIVNYLNSAEKNLREAASRALISAADPLGPQAAAISTMTGDKPAAPPVAKAAIKPKLKPKTETKMAAAPGWRREAIR